MVILSALFAITLAMLIIWRSSDGFEVASGYLGRNLTDGVRGATINAVGSSIPELFTTLFSLMLLGEVDNFAFGIGTTAGSAIFNGMIIPAVVIIAVIGYGIAHKVKVSKKVILRDGIGLIIAELILIYMVSGNHLTWMHGLGLMFTYVVYVAYMFSTMKTKEGVVLTTIEEVKEYPVGRKPTIVKSLLLLDFEHVFIRKQINTLNAWMLLLFSMLVIGLACIVLIHSCELLSGEMGLPLILLRLFWLQPQPVSQTRFYLTVMRLQGTMTMPLLTRLGAIFLIFASPLAFHCLHLRSSMVPLA